MFQRSSSEIKRWLLLSSMLCMVTSLVHAQTYTVLHTCTKPTGWYPYHNVNVYNGHLYGMLPDGGTHNDGVIFTMDTNGAGYRVLFEFAGTNGSTPYGSLLIVGSTMYGMTCLGGANFQGLIFSVDTDGTGFADLHDFGSIPNDGAIPYGSLILAGGNLYGMAAGGLYSDGIIFSIQSNGNGYKKILDFNGTNGHGSEGDLTAAGRRLYGLSNAGGTSNAGVIFRIDTTGANDTVLYSFSVGAGGQYPYGNVTILHNKLYGTTESGGIFGDGNIFSIDSDGKGYIDMYDFQPAYGVNPLGNLTLLGNAFYGLTDIGGLTNDGCIFSIDTSGNNFQRLLNFTGVAGAYPGRSPLASLTLSGSSFYGMTASGGANDSGVVFKFDTGSISTAIRNVQSSSQTITVEPNPSNGYFTITLSHAELVSASQPIVEVYNIMGEKVTIGMLKQVQHDYALDLSTQPSGVYFYRVMDEGGSLIGSGKLIIQK